MSICIVHQIRIAELTKELEELKAKDNVTHLLELEAEVVRLRRVAEAAEIFVKAPNDFTLEILTDSLVKS